jgi:hypothetical protein
MLLRDRHLLRDTDDGSCFRLGRLVDPDLEQRRLWPVE